MNTTEKTTEIFHYPSEEPQKGIIFLHPEQIHLFSGGKKSRGGENVRIRMAESVRKYGVLQPFSVRIWQKNGGFPCYQLVGEEERFRAVCMAGVERIPCVLLSGEDKRCIELSLLDEYLGKGMHFLDEARLFDRLMRQFSMKQAEIAAKCGLSQSSVANKLRLLQLTDREQESIRRASLGERHARAILRISDPKIRQDALETVILRHLSVVQTEELVDSLNGVAPDSAVVGGRETAVLSPEKNEYFVFRGGYSAENPAHSPSEPSTRQNSAGWAGAFACGTSRASGGVIDRVDREKNCINPVKTPENAQKSIAYSPFGGQITPEKPPFGASGAGDSGAERAAAARRNATTEEPTVSRRVTAEIPAPVGILPRKFVLHDLRPLYNSIERTLSIFRKTGMNAECSREEAEDAVRIYIKIPRKSAPQ